MGTLLKYCLSCLFILVIFACKEDYSKLSKKERRALAEEVFKGGAHLFQGSPKSMSRIEKAIAIDSTYAEAIRELSVAYLKRGMPHKWKPIQDRAAQKDPKTWVPWRGYLYLYFYRDYQKAIADFNASDTLTPYLDQPQGHSVDFWRGIAYLGLNDYENSIAYWDSHIQKETEEAGEDWVELEAFLYRGIAYYESGHKEKALADFNKIIHLFKNSADAKYYKAKVLSDFDKSEDALELAEEALSDFKSGYFNHYHYVELLRQLYLDDIEELIAELK
jgi:tetratricopeptide (TPR) repeat protein